MIETEPSVHFAAYDTVFDETTNDISQRYSPKDTYPPRITISSTSDEIGTDGVEDLEPAADDDDMPLSATGDFQVLA
jgi:hypothetical protein